MIAPVAGHLFVVLGDARRLACSAWLLPCDLHGTVSPGWLDDEPELRVRVEQFRPLAVDAFESGSRVARLPGDTRPHVWMVNTGGFRGMSDEWYADGLRAYVEGAAVALPAESPRLIAAPFVGAGLGGKAYDKGTLLPALLETLTDGARSADADIAFVVRDRRAFAAAQAFRRRDPSRYWSTLDEGLAEIADGLAERAAAGSLVAFFGAGVSRAAGLPSWEGLLAHLAADAGIDGDVARELAELPLVDQALILENRLGGASGLRERIAALVGGEAYTLAHALLAGLPATEFVTTNYDELFELAAMAAGMPVVRLPYESVTSSRQRWLLKLHGTVGAPSDIVLTREDYLRYPDRRGALAALVQALLITRHMLFVGFSLGDDNFHRIVDDVRKALGERGADPAPFGTALMVRAPSFTRELWHGDLDVVAVDESEVDLVLDRVLAVSTTLSEFLLDDSFTGLLTPEEARLKSLLAPLERELSDGLGSAQAVDQARRLLESFGSSAL
jgi:SIR2-like domain